VPFNEGWGQHDTGRIVEWLKSADPTRLVNNASGWTDMRVGDVAAIRVSRPANDGHSVACGIPGYERVGSEYYADEARVQDDPFDWQLEGKCAYSTTFEYTSG